MAGTNPCTLSLNDLNKATRSLSNRAQTLVVQLSLSSAHTMSVHSVHIRRWMFPS